MHSTLVCISHVKTIIIIETTSIIQQKCVEKLYIIMVVNNIVHRNAVVVKADYQTITLDNHDFSPTFLAI